MMLSKLNKKKSFHFYLITSGGIIMKILNQLQFWLIFRAPSYLRNQQCITRELRFHNTKKINQENCSVNNRTTNNKKLKQIAKIDQFEFGQK